MNKISIDVLFVRIGQYLNKIQLFKKLGNLQNIFMEHDLYLIS